MINSTQDYLPTNVTKDNKMKTNHPLINSYQYPPSNSNQIQSLYTSSNIKKIFNNHLQNAENIDLNNLVLKNSNPIIDQGIWYAIRLNDGRTVFRKDNPFDGQYFSIQTSNHLTSDPNTAYSGPVNFINSNVTITTGAVISGSNFLSNNDSSLNTPNLTINNGGKLEDSNVFNQTVVMNSGYSDNNTYISCPVTMNGGSTSDTDSFINANNTTSSYNFDGPSFSNKNYQNTSDQKFLSSNNGTANINVKDTSLVINPNIPNRFLYNPATARIVIHVDSTAQFATRQVVGTSLENILKNINISNNNFNIIGNNYTSTLYVSSETIQDENGNYSIQQAVYKDVLGNVLYKGNDPVNIYNVQKIIVQDGGVLNGAKIFGNNYPRILIQKGGLITNSEIYDCYIGIENGGKSINNFYYSPYFLFDQDTSIFGTHLLEGLSMNDTFYEGSTTYQGILNIANNKNVYFDGINKPVLNNRDGINHNPPNNSLFTVCNADTDININPTGQLVNPTMAMNSNYTIEYSPGKFNASQPCYLAGTLIETTNGLKTIEKIEVGDLIYTYKGTIKIPKPVIWIGSGYHNVQANQPDDIAGYAIHIIKNALADYVPYKDMFITPEHCLYIDGKFIPARMLVNNHSIYYDYSKSKYTYYHLELEEHGVINADGALSESFLNTNNHQNFYNPKKVIKLKEKTKNWAQDAAAALVTKQEIVKPIYDYLKQRALQLNLQTITEEQKTTNFSNLYIITDKGKVIFPKCCKTQFGNYIFVLSNPVHYIYIVSNSSRPSDIIGPYVDDRRNLGVLIESITLFDQKNNHSITTHLEAKQLSGWHDQENESFRWTNGYALLPLTQYHQSSDCNILTLKVIAAGPYIINHQQINQQKQAV